MTARTGVNTLMTMSENAQQSSRNLAELRIRAGLTQRQLAAHAGIPRATVSDAEHGRVPRPATQLQIADVLGVDVLEIWPLNGIAA